MDIVERLQGMSRMRAMTWVTADKSKRPANIYSEAADEIERLRKDYALACENHILHEQIFVLMEAKVERLQEAIVEIVYQIGQGNNVAAMDIAAPIAVAALQQKESKVMTDNKDWFVREPKVRLEENISMMHIREEK